MLAQLDYNIWVTNPQHLKSYIFYSYVGGICGFNDGTALFDNCVNDGDITGGQYYSGILGSGFIRQSIFGSSSAILRKD